MSLFTRFLDEAAEEQYCKVYDRNDFFTTLVQIMLALGALASLYFKRLREKPRRTIRTWSLDIGKQGIGACYAHVLNMVSCHWRDCKLRRDPFIVLIHTLTYFPRSLDYCVYHFSKYTR